MDPDVYRHGDQPARLQGNAPSGYGRLGEARVRFLAVPREELVHAEVVHPARDRGGDAAQYQRLQALPFVGLRNNN